MLSDLNTRIREVRRIAQEANRRDLEHQKAVTKAIGDGEGKGKLGKRGGLGEDDDDGMDLDEGLGGRTRGATSGGGNILGGRGRRFGSGRGG